MDFNASVTQQEYEALVEKLYSVYAADQDEEGE